MKVEIVKDSTGYWPKVYDGAGVSCYIEEKGFFKKTYSLWCSQHNAKKYCNVYNTQEDALACLNRYYKHVKNSTPHIVYKADW